MKKKNLIVLCAGVVLLLGTGSWITFKQIQYSHAEKYMKSIGINPDSFSKEDVVSFWDEISSKNELSDSTKEILKKESGTIIGNLTDSSKKTISELIESGAFDTLLSAKKIPPGEAGKIIPHLSDDQVNELIDQLNKDNNELTFSGTVIAIQENTLIVSCPDNSSFQKINLIVSPLCQVVFSDNSKASFNDILKNDSIHFTITKLSASGSSASDSNFEGTASFIKINP